MAAAAYASLVSLTNLIEQTMVHSADQPSFLDKQLRQLESLQIKVSFLQDLLEVYSYEDCNNLEEEGLASRIADAAHAAEDIVESHVVNSIVPKRQSKNKEKKENEFCLQEVIESLDSIRKELMVVKEKTIAKDQKASDVMPVVSSRPPTTRKDTKVVHYGDELEHIMDKLTGQSSNLQIIPIVGMGGIGKTTLARDVYENKLVVECFPFRAWVTVSQEYDLQEMFYCILHQIGLSINKSCEYHQLGEKLHKHLSGRKYLIILDDIWSTDVWEKLKLFLPDYNNGSRVIITTRLLNAVDSSDTTHLYKMNLLDKNKSWSLLCTKVFGHDGNCPSELEEIGKDIAKNCKGLPLYIVVIGGLLAKSEMTRKYWEYVAKDIKRIVNSEDNGRWLNTLYLSYSQLPIYLKPCFLYMGVYKEDHYIRISKLIKLWVAEGFLKPCKSKSLEEVAEDYLKDLIERNLIFVRRWGSLGKMKTCGIHDLLRELCLKEAHKERFFGVLKPNNLAKSVKNERRMVFKAEDWFPERISIKFDLALPATTPFARSLPCDNDESSISWNSVDNFRLILVLANDRAYSLKSIFELVNLTYLKCDLEREFSDYLPPMCHLRYLQTLILITDDVVAAPYEIWEMPQLRHLTVKSGIRLPDTLCGGMDGQDDCVLKNLQTLEVTYDSKFTDEVIKRIPNIKKLSIAVHLWQTINYYSLHNLGRLHKLQSLACAGVQKMDFLHNIAFPHSLNKLTLVRCEFDWDNLTTKVGSLLHLERLKLDHCHSGAEWNTVEGKFLRLKFLEINSCNDLVCWTADSTPFPLLQHLVLTRMSKLEGIPSSIGDTLQSLKLFGCGDSVIASGKEILEEQQSFGNEDFRLTVGVMCGMKMLNKTTKVNELNPSLVHALGTDSIFFFFFDFLTFSVWRMDLNDERLKINKDGGVK